MAGGLALIMEARPDLSPQEAADILLAAARRQGLAGADARVGRGFLDIGRAFEAATRRRPAMAAREGAGG